MKIINELPPVYDDIIAGGMSPGPYALYTYGDIIYNPSGQEVPPEIIEHEEVHEKQQAEIGVEHWWSRFIDDQYFRLNQEVEAYAVQYRFMCNIHKDRNKRSNILMHYAKILASPTYGSVVTTMSARKMIKDKANI